MNDWSRRKPPRTPGGLGAKLTIISKIDDTGEVTYFTSLGRWTYPIPAALAYALVRNGYACFLTAEQAHDDLFG